MTTAILVPSLPIAERSPAHAFSSPQGGQVRFANNDVRVINNVLYEKIASEKLIHQVVNAQATLVQLQGIAVQGRVHFCAWITVSFSLFQSRIDPASGQRTEGLLHNPATGQPTIYQYVRVTFVSFTRRSRNHFSERNS
jgi:hypothetical protein